MEITLSTIINLKSDNCKNNIWEVGKIRGFNGLEVKAYLQQITELSPSPRKHTHGNLLKKKNSIFILI